MRRTGSDHASARAPAAKSAMVRKAAWNAKAISAWIAAWSAAGREASTPGPCSRERAKSPAASGSRAASTANKTAPTTAVPRAAPTERENCTEAAAAPSLFWPATAWTVTCTTLMTVPMNKAFTLSRMASCALVSWGHPYGKQHQHGDGDDQPVGRHHGRPPGSADELPCQDGADADADRQGQEQETGIGGRQALGNPQVDRHEGDERHQGRPMTSRHGVAAPHGWLPEQPDRQQRRPGPLLLPYEPEQGRDGDRDQGGDAGQRLPLNALRLFHGEE